MIRRTTANVPRRRCSRVCRFSSLIHCTCEQSGSRGERLAGHARRSHDKRLPRPTRGRNRAHCLRWQWHRAYDGSASVASYTVRFLPAPTSIPIASTSIPATNQLLMRLQCDRLPVCRLMDRFKKQETRARLWRDVIRSVVWLFVGLHGGEFGRLIHPERFHDD